MTPKQQLVAETAAALHSYGYQVYLSKTRTWGFFTDGKHIVCFGGQLSYSLDFTGNYRAATDEAARSVGTGWQIAKDQGVPTSWDAERYINAEPPRWATNGLAVTRTTPDQHLTTYGQSSGYTLYQPEEQHATD